MPDLDIDNLLDGGADDGGDLIKTLRAALKAQKTELQEVKAQRDKFLTESRSTSLADVFRAKGLDAKAAKLYPSDADVTAEAVDAWLGEYGDLFGISNAETSATEQVQNAAARIQNANASAPAGTITLDPSALAAEMKAAKNETELAAVLAKLPR